MKAYFLGCAVALLASTQAMAATVAAEAFSRGNCRAYIPGYGYGWYNESISYDALTGTHYNLFAKSSQTNRRGVPARSNQSNNPAGYRVRAGYVDPISDPTFWYITGAHRETLDSGRIVSFNTSATDCNLHPGQFL
jgi:hypothetical protein